MLFVACYLPEISAYSSACRGPRWPSNANYLITFPDTMFGPYLGCFKVGPTQRRRKQTSSVRPNPNARPTRRPMQNRAVIIAAKCRAKVSFLFGLSCHIVLLSYSWFLCICVVTIIDIGLYTQSGHDTRIGSASSVTTLFSACHWPPCLPVTTMSTSHWCHHFYQIATMSTSHWCSLYSYMLQKCRHYLPLM